jgi:WhiB family redox-sensing transcriptional regulator
MDSIDWRRSAACRFENPELFFPVSGVGPGARQTGQAKAVCARCPVWVRCLDVALESGLDHGIFGGMTEGERRELVHRARLDAAISQWPETTAGTGATLRLVGPPTTGRSLRHPAREASEPFTR